MQAGESHLSIDLDGGRQVLVDFGPEWGTRAARRAEFVPLLDGRLAPEQKLVW